VPRIVPKQESRLVLAADGTWRHDGERASHARLSRFLHGCIRRDESGAYYLHNAFVSESGATLEEHVYFEVEDTALFVRSATVDGGAPGLAVELNTGEHAQSDEESLSVGPDGVLSCEVRGERARFGREAMVKLEPLLGEDERGYFLVAGDRRLRIRYALDARPARR
jgi:hypothetical protein